MKVYLIEVYSTGIDKKLEGYFIGIYRVAGETYPAYSVEINEKVKIYKTLAKAKMGVRSLENRFLFFNFEVKEIEKSDK